MEAEVVGSCFKSKLISSQTEKDVENAYRAEFLKHLPKALITSPYKTDGVLEADTLHVLLEFKNDVDFGQRTEVIKPIVQSLVYLKSFWDGQDRIPTAVFVGDKNECFMLGTDPLVKYLNRSDIDWSVAASSAWKLLSQLYRDMIQDEDINPYILDVRERGFYFKDVVKGLKSLHEGTVHRVPISVGNIAGIFRSWSDTVLKQDLKPQPAVGAFLKSVLGKAYVHPQKADTLVVGDDEVSIDGAKHEAFFEWFQSEYKVTQKRHFTAIKDRLIEEDSRRRSGDFYTPTVWANEAHKMLDAQLGPNWRDEYVVWDCACGSSNLTRDYKFNQLYLSTLFEDDVDMVKQMGYNRGAETFQFDFLNDPIPGGPVIDSETSKIPAGLVQALQQGKKMVFLINPPFGTACAGGAKGVNKEGVGNTLVNDKMGLGHARQQLYAQFMWRISEIVDKYELEDAFFGLYSVPLFTSGSSFKKFRKYFYDKWNFEDGFLFRADEFNGTASSWGVSFTTWSKK